MQVEELLEGEPGDEVGLRVLGQFFYSQRELGDCMGVELRWEAGLPVGVLHIAPAVSKLLKGSDYEHIRSGEILAGLTESHLVLSGERTVWNANWGALLDLPPNVEFGLQGSIDLAERITRRFHS
jgi:hypothetical protein